eukprot:161545-Rhodomonas_salina.2
MSWTDLSTARWDAEQAHKQVAARLPTYLYCPMSLLCDVRCRHTPVCYAPRLLVCSIPSEARRAVLCSVCD